MHVVYSPRKFTQSSRRRIAGNSNLASARRSTFPGSLVVVSRVYSADGKWSYRYTGARLLSYGNERWFLIVTPRQRGYRSTVFTLRDTESVRVEATTPASG